MVAECVNVQPRQLPTEESHTAGPWTLTHKRGNNFAVQEWEIRGMFGDKPNISPIFNVDIFAIHGTTFCASPQDARLIAAAPDLLALAKKLASECAECRGVGHSMVDTGMPVDSRVDCPDCRDIHVVIAKAEGRS